MSLREDNYLPTVHAAFELPCQLYHTLNVWNTRARTCTRM